MRVKILDVSVENVVKGKSRYSKAAVAYSYNGEARTQNIMSFVNPGVWKTITDPAIIGTEVEVNLTKNAAGYNEWAGIGEAGNAPQAAPSAGTAPSGSPGNTRVTGSNYETPAERAQRQVYIVKQSSISAAVALASNNKEKASPAEIIASAQVFVDYVFDTDNSIKGMKSDEL